MSVENSKLMMLYSHLRPLDSLKPYIVFTAFIFHNSKLQSQADPACKITVKNIQFNTLAISHNLFDHMARDKAVILYYH